MKIRFLKLYFIFNKILLIFILLLIYLHLCAQSYVSAISSDISENVFRLHVVANSNSKEDQDLKYLVRDKIISYMNSIIGNSSSKQEFINIASSNINNIKKIASETIKENGFNYDVSVEISKTDFPTKVYGDISLPTGNYDALNVKIGNSSGQNWWCVMFPPLCFVDVSSGIVPDSSKEQLKSNLSDEEYLLISKNAESSENIKIKFKLIEFLNSNKLFTAKN